MKQKVANYISNFLVTNEITHLFTVTGGGAMHLNDAFGHQKGLTCVYNHHEQACSIAAESYARINNKIAAVCVTTGPGGTNAITGVAGGFVDSIPMLIISGQVRYDTTVRSTGLNLRSFGDQELDICKLIEPITKYCEMVTDPKRIRYCLEKALYLSQHGRPGPCWLDIPLNVQGAYVDTEELNGFDDKELNSYELDDNIIDTIIEKIKNAKRPVLYAGSGIRASKGYMSFRKIIDKLNIPIVTAWNSIDLIEDVHPLYVGRAGIMGDRAGNFAVQNSDLVFSVGCRLSIRQVGYNWKTWAREAYKIIVDIDSEELKKPTLSIDMPVCADAKELFEKIDLKLNDNDKLFNNLEWLERCNFWKSQYPVVLERHNKNIDRLANPYYFIKEISNHLNQNQITVVGNGTACVVGSQGYIIKKGQRFIINSGMASMGYDLPAAIGASYANDTNLDIICITGDGSIQMNLQELQTIIHNKLPIKIFIINNNGYHSIRQTQTNLFGGNFVGIGPESKDLSFPKMSKIAEAYGYSYFSASINEEIPKIIEDVLSKTGPIICEIFVSPKQFFEPKSATKKLEDGSLYSPPLEDLAPFLSREELKENMIIPLLEEK